MDCAVVKTKLSHALDTNIVTSQNDTLICEDIENSAVIFCVLYNSAKTWKKLLLYSSLYWLIISPIVADKHYFIPQIKAALYDWSFYKAFNSIFRKVGRVASEEITVQLLESKCFSFCCVVLYSCLFFLFLLFIYLFIYSIYQSTIRNSMK